MENTPEEYSGVLPISIFLDILRVVQNEIIGSNTSAYINKLEINVHNPKSSTASVRVMSIVAIAVDIAVTIVITKIISPECVTLISDKLTHIIYYRHCLYTKLLFEK